MRTMFSHWTILTNEKGRSDREGSRFFGTVWLPPSLYFITSYLLAVLMDRVDPDFQVILF